MALRRSRCARRPRGARAPEHVALSRRCSRDGRSSRGAWARPSRRSAALVAVFLLALCATIAPATLRNRWVSGDFVLVNATGGLLLYDSWNPDRVLDVQHPRHLPARARRRSDRAQERLHRSGAARARPSASRIGGLRVLARRGARIRARRAVARARPRPRASARLFWNRHEPWDIRSFTVSRTTSWVLSLPLPGFGVIAPLALAGIALSAARWRRLAPLYGLDPRVLRLGRAVRRAVPLSRSGRAAARDLRGRGRRVDLGLCAPRATRAGSRAPSRSSPWRRSP